MEQNKRLEKYFVFPVSYYYQQLTNLLSLIAEIQPNS